MTKIFLPAIHSNAPVVGQGMSANAMIFAVAWMEALDERAEYMLLDDRLVTAAMLHAIYLDSRTPAEIAERANVSHASHYGRDWSMSNDRVLDAGYKLPREYERGHNNVESCARNPDPIDALNRLLASEFHGPHLRGEGNFSPQIFWGVGNCGDDYVALTAPEAA